MLKTISKTLHKHIKNIASVIYKRANLYNFLFFYSRVNNHLSLNRINTFWKKNHKIWTACLLDNIININRQHLVTFPISETIFVNLNPKHHQSSFLSLRHTQMYNYYSDKKIKTQKIFKFKSHLPAPLRWQSTYRWRWVYTREGQVRRGIHRNVPPRCNNTQWLSWHLLTHCL